MACANKNGISNSIAQMSSSSSKGKFSSHDTPGYVGFANLPNQVHRNSVKKGFEFTLMAA